MKPRTMAGLAMVLLSVVVHAAPVEGGGDGIELKVTMTTEPAPACGEVTSLSVVAGDPVNYCFTVTNHTDQTLTHHVLNNDQFAPTYPSPGDPFFSYYDLVGAIEGEIPPGGTLQHNVVITAGADRAADFVWASSAGEPRYDHSTTAADFQDISAFGSPVTVPVETYISPMPFPFVFYGLPTGLYPSDGVCIRSSGTAQLLRHFIPCYGEFVTDFAGDNPEPDPILPLPLIPDGGNALMGFWDWFLSDHGVVYHAVLGEAPNRSLVIQWDQWHHAYWEGVPGFDCTPAPGSDGITFQIILEEGTGRIRYVYADTEFGTDGDCGWEHGMSAAVALAGMTRDPRDVFSWNQPLTDGLEVIWTPTTSTHVAKAQARLTVGVPHIATNPLAIEASVVAGHSRSQPLAIANGGTHRLEWSLDRASPKAHFPRQKRIAHPIGDPTKTRSTSRVPPNVLVLPYEALAPTAAESAPFSLLGEDAVPAYATKIEVGRTPPYGGLVQTIRNITLNATDPSYLVWTGLGDTSIVHAGDFIGDDFSRQYLLTSRIFTDYSFEVLDTATGEVALIGQARPQAIHEWEETWQGMSWDRTTDALFAVSSMCAGGSGVSGLYRIDPATAVPTFIGQIDIDSTSGCIGDIAIAPDGAMYAIDLTGDSLLAIDKTTGEAAVIGSVGFDLNDKNSMDFDDVSGILYLAAYTQGEGINGGIYTLDLGTGIATRIGPFPRMEDSWWLSMTGFSIARAGGTCAHPGEVTWLSTDVVEGATQPGAESIIGVVLDAADLEPGRYEAHLCVSSNDRRQPLKAVPVGLTVVDAELIFADGFDGPPR